MTLKNTSLVFASCFLLAACGDAEPGVDESENVESASEALSPTPLTVNGSHVKKIVGDTHHYTFWRINGKQYTIHMKQLPGGDADLYASKYDMTDGLEAAQKWSQNPPPQNDWIIFTATDSGPNYVAVYAYTAPATYELWVTTP